MANIKIILFTSKKYSNNESPVSLRITHQRKTKYITLGFTCLPTQWNKETCRFRKNYPEYNARNVVLDQRKMDANVILEDYTKEKRPFTFQDFEDRFRIDTKDSCTVYNFFETRIDEIHKPKTKKAYRDTMNVLLRFRAGKDLMFGDIDYNFLKKFEAQLLKNGATGGGISFYMRTLRALINQAINRGYLKREQYPFANQFNRNGYSLGHLKSNANPRALSLEDMEKIKRFPLNKHLHLQKSVKYFLFSYYARGMNFKDMANLQWSDIYNERIIYTRSKTGKPLNLKVSKPLQEILDFFKENYPHDQYVFPVLNDFHKTDAQITNRTEKCRKQYNKELKEIAKVLNISATLSSYVARHSYSQTLKLKGIDISVISEALGHQDVGTTKAYLSQFETETIDKADEVL